MIMEKRRLSNPWLFGLLADRPTSLSLSMHNAGFRSLGLPYFYAAFDTADTQGGLQAMRTLGIRGFSLTIPHKEQALNLVDTLAADARRAGCINTVINDGAELFGYNTDIFGVQQALTEAGIQTKTLGAGGAARAGVLALQKLGAKRIQIANRTDRRAEQVAEELGGEFLPWSRLREAEQADLLLQSTPLGSHLTSESLSEEFLEICPLARSQVVFDMVTRETPLLREAAKLGKVCIPGSRMLLFQAVEQFRLFTGIEAPQSVLEGALHQALAV